MLILTSIQGDFPHLFNRLFITNLINFYVSAYNCVICIPIIIISSPKFPEISSKNVTVKSKFVGFSSQAPVNSLSLKRFFFRVSNASQRAWHSYIEVNSKRVGLLTHFYFFFLIENGNVNSHPSWKGWEKTPQSTLI